jgi:solute carrier family 25 protein 16
MLAFGAVAGLVAQTATYPLDLVRRRMQAQGGGRTALSALATARLIWTEGGWRGLFRGLSINYMKVIPRYVHMVWVLLLLTQSMLLPAIC